jgi:hypothetical protein
VAVQHTDQNKQGNVTLFNFLLGVLPSHTERAGVRRPTNGTSMFLSLGPLDSYPNARIFPSATRFSCRARVVIFRAARPDSRLAVFFSLEVGGQVNCLRGFSLKTIISGWDISVVSYYSLDVLPDYMPSRRKIYVLCDKRGAKHLNFITGLSRETPRCKCFREFLNGRQLMAGVRCVRQRLRVGTFILPNRQGQCKVI